MCFFAYKLHFFYIFVPLENFLQYSKGFQIQQQSIHYRLLLALLPLEQSKTILTLYEFKSLKNKIYAHWEKLNTWATTCLNKTVPWSATCTHSMANSRATFFSLPFYYYMLSCFLPLFPSTISNMCCHLNLKKGISQLSPLHLMKRQTEWSHGACH